MKKEKEDLRGLPLETVQQLSIRLVGNYEQPKVAFVC